MTKTTEPLDGWDTGLGKAARLFTSLLSAYANRDDDVTAKQLLEAWDVLRLSVQGEQDCEPPCCITGTQVPVLVRYLCRHAGHDDGVSVIEVVDDVLLLRCGGCGAGLEVTVHEVRGAVGS